MFISFIKFFLDPFNILWILALTLLFIWYLKKKRLLKWLLGISAIFFLSVSTPLIPVLVIDSLEDRYVPLYTKQLDDLGREYHIIVLGGGHGFDDRLPPNSLLSQKALGRLNEGIRLHRQLPSSKMVFSGFSASGGTTQAEMLEKTARLLGVDKERTILQNEPGNTFEEAKVYSENYGNRHPVILVTNATHMPRAMMSFKKFGIEPFPSPTNYRLLGSWKYKRIGLPDMSNIEHLRVGIYEYAGLIWYHLKS